jgi:hypothetical protein
MPDNALEQRPELPANAPEVDHPGSAAVDPAIRSVRAITNAGSAGPDVEPPWPEHPSGQELQWESFMRCYGPFEAHIVAGRLNVEGVPTVVLSAPGVDFSPSAEILVPHHLLHRARWVLAWPPPSDEELQFMATGVIRA